MVSTTAVVCGMVKPDGLGVIRPCIRSTGHPWMHRDEYGQTWSTGEGGPRAGDPGELSVLLAEERRAHQETRAHRDRALRVAQDYWTRVGRLQTQLDAMDHGAEADVEADGGGVRGSGGGGGGGGVREGELVATLVASLVSLARLSARLLGCDPLPLLMRARDELLRDGDGAIGPTTTTGDPGGTPPGGGGG